MLDFEDWKLAVKIQLFDMGYSCDRAETELQIFADKVTHWHRQGTSPKQAASLIFVPF